jgi:hypothetical protein
MRLIFIIKILTISCVLTISCTSYVSISTHLPPAIIVPEDTVDFLFVNRFIPDALDYKNENKTEVYKIGLESYIKGLKDGFDKNKKFFLILADTTLPSHSAHEPAYNLSMDVIGILCEEYNPDYILSLDNYDLFFDKEVEVQEYDDGSKSKTAYYDLVLNTYLTIYSINGAVLDKLKEELRILHDERGVVSGLFAVGPSLGKADDNVLKISNELGEKFIEYFYPSKITELRPFYSSKEFSAAYKAFRIGDWETVETELLSLTEKPDSKVLGKAAYNLGVLYEHLGKTVEMEYWYQVAQEKLGSLPTAIY